MFLFVLHFLLTLAIVFDVLMFMMCIYTHLSFYFILFYFILLTCMCVCAGVWECMCLLACMHEVRVSIFSAFLCVCVSLHNV